MLRSVINSISDIDTDTDEEIRKINAERKLKLSRKQEKKSSSSRSSKEEKKPRRRCRVSPYKCCDPFGTCPKICPQFGLVRETGKLYCSWCEEEAGLLKKTETVTLQDWIKYLTN